MHPLLHRARQKLSLPHDLMALFVGETGLEWSFSPIEKRYYSFRGGVLNSRIRGQSIPDPHVTFKERCERLGITTDSPDAAAQRPTRDAYQLWDDWKMRECINA